MVDCRPAAGAPSHELALSAPNGGPPPPPPENNHHNQGGGSGDMGHGVASPVARSSTPASTTAIATYGGAGVGVGAMPPGGGYAPYYGGGGKALGGGVLWMPPAPMPPPPPPLPPHVNPHVYKSVQPNGSDLPMNDIPTLRWYFNLGVDCMWANYGPPPPRHYSPRDMAQDMQQMSLHERSPHDMNKHKPAGDKQGIPPPKGNGQRSLVGPRFNKRNHDGSQNPNQNKGHNNNNMANKGPNNRRGSHESRGAQHAYSGAPVAEAECVVEAPLLTMPYIPYPPPVYPIQYYPVDSNDPGMMGMMGGMGYVNYEEAGEYVQPYYPHPLYPQHPPAHAPLHPHMQLHQEHK